MGLLAQPGHALLSFLLCAIPWGLEGGQGLLQPRRWVICPLSSSPSQILPLRGAQLAQSGGGVEPPAQSSQVPVGCCPRLPFLLRVLSLLLFIQGFPTQCVEQYFRGRVGSQTDSRLHLGKLLGLSGLFFFFFLLICKIKQKSPTLQVVVMIKLWFSTLAVHQNSLGSPKMPMPGLHPD